MVATANYTCCRGFFSYRDGTHLLKRNNGLLLCIERGSLRRCERRDQQHDGAGRTDRA